MCRTPKMSIHNQIRSMLIDTRIIHGIVAGIILYNSYQYFKNTMCTRKYTNQYIKNDFYQDNKKDDENDATQYIDQNIKWDIIGS
jgi:hypothetical protein